MLPRNKTLPRKPIVHTKRTKTNKRNSSKLIKQITVTKEEHTIHSRGECSEEYVLTYRIADSLWSTWETWQEHTVIPLILLLLKSILCLDESRIPFKSFNLFEDKYTINNKLFSIALSASSSAEADDDDEFDEMFSKRHMLPRNKTLRRKLIVHTKRTKRNKRNSSKLINKITVSKEKHSIHSRVESSEECVLTYRVADFLWSASETWQKHTVIPLILLLMKSILCLDESRIRFWFKSFNLFQHKCTINQKLFSIALSAASFGTDADDEFDETFSKRRMLRKNKTLPRNVIIYTEIAKTNKRKNNSILINVITETKQEHSIHTRLECSVECGLTYGVFILSRTVMWQEKNRQ